MSAAAGSPPCRNGRRTSSRGRSTRRPVVTSWVEGRKERLILGEAGVTVRLSPTERLTVRYRDLVVAAHVENERLLVGRDGMRIRVRAEDWKDGTAILERLDVRVSPELIACDTHSAGALVDPEGRT